MPPFFLSLYPQKIRLFFTFAFLLIQPIICSRVSIVDSLRLFQSVQSDCSDHQIGFRCANRKKLKIGYELVNHRICKLDKKKKVITRSEQSCCWSVVTYGISTLVGYLMSNPVYSNILKIYDL